MLWEGFFLHIKITLVSNEQTFKKELVDTMIAGMSRATSPTVAAADASFLQSRHVWLFA